MSKALLLGVAALVFSAASASAQVYTEPVADLAVPADGYAAPAAPPVYAAPPIYAAPVYTAPTVVYMAPAVVYAAPPPVYVAPTPLPAPLPSRRIYAYAPGHWGG
jgi:hypothetical protein